MVAAVLVFVDTVPYLLIRRFLEFRPAIGRGCLGALILRLVVAKALW